MFVAVPAITAGSALGLIGPLLVGLALAGFGFAYLRPAVFDRASGRFWLGWLTPGEGSAMGDRNCRLADIHAIQLLREQVERRRRYSSSLFWSHELNLVLRDGRRINVVDHSDIDALRSDAAQVASMLGCKVWDATAGDPGASTAPTPAKKNPVLSVIGSLLGTIMFLAMAAAIGLIVLAEKQPEKLHQLIELAQPYVDKFLR